MILLLASAASFVRTGPAILVARPAQDAPLACERPVLGSFALPHGARAPLSAFTSVSVHCAPGVSYRVVFSGGCVLEGVRGELVPFEVMGGPGYATPLLGCGVAPAELDGLGSQTFLIEIRRAATGSLPAGAYSSDLDVRLVPR